MTLAAEVTFATNCSFVSLQVISFVVVVSFFNKLLPNVIFSYLFIASEKENNLQGTKITNIGQSHQLAVLNDLNHS